ncbi:MAG: hypothetical protein ACKVQW_01240 [Pyrinomonadaceae bacterium]
MTTHSQREIVIEYERIQLIRKKAKTEFTHCDECGGEADFVAIDSAAELFEIHIDDLSAFINGNNCHHHTAAKMLVCINSLLATIKTRLLDHQLKLGGTV